MAAVIHPDQRFRPSPTSRPDLRLVDRPKSGGHRGGALRDELGLSTTAVVATAVAFLVIVVGVLALGQGAFASLGPEPPAVSAATSVPVVAGPGGDMVVVQAGDTLWSIARRLQPTGDVRPLVDQLVAANGSTLVVAGDQLIIER